MAISTDNQHIKWGISPFIYLPSAKLVQHSAGLGFFISSQVRLNLTSNMRTCSLSKPFFLLHPCWAIIDKNVAASNLDNLYQILNVVFAEEVERPRPANPMVSHPSGVELMDPPSSGSFVQPRLLSSKSRKGSFSLGALGSSSALKWVCPVIIFSSQ